MKAGLTVVLAMLALSVGGCKKEGAGNSFAPKGGPVAPIPAPAGSDWTQIVSDTPDGGYRMGNPAAPVKLVEYASYSCPHCAEFAREATQPLQNDYVKSGRVSWEYRPFLLFPSDPAIATLVRCQGPDASFLLAEQLYAQQADWEGKMQSMSKEQRSQLDNLPRQQQLAALIKVTGLDEFFRQRGMPQSRIDSCLADQAQLERLAQITTVGSDKYHVEGTPTFFINGQKVPDAASWQQLQPVLNQALGQ